MRLVRPAIVARMMVVLGDVERIDPDGIREHRLLDCVANDDSPAQLVTRFVETERDERVQSELDVLGAAHL
jgi:hypothetical protein